MSILQGISEIIERLRTQIDDEYSSRHLGNIMGVLVHRQLMSDIISLQSNKDERRVDHSSQS